ncbi:MAG: hypothetical protein K0S26_3216 [Bacteroidota bacterium]|nr:hypothetical protein [Bacteroidota bacterium]
MLHKSKIVLIILVLLNTVVLSGQIWPEGVPPFARVVNIVFLVLSFLFFVNLLRQKKS